MTLLRSLTPGTKFQVPGRIGTLVYATDCRAYVRWEATKTTSFETQDGEQVEFTKARFDSIAPNCEVEEC